MVFEASEWKPSSPLEVCVSRLGPVTTAAAIALLGAVACHRSQVVTATPVPAATSTDNTARDAAAREQARRDSIARADAARRDSLARAEAARRAAADREAAARAALNAAVYFDFDMDALTSDASARLEAKVPVMQANRDVRIRVEGHTDERGSDEYNLALGQRRAAAAKRFLVSRGVDEARIETVSYGEERATCSEHEESCWSKNRRDEFVVTAGARFLGSRP
jgi:peptidoglycan-associated lipoprotein